MTKKYWFKAAVLIGLGTMLQLPFAGGCLQAAVQRILVAVNFD